MIIGLKSLNLFKWHPQPRYNKARELEAVRFIKESGSPIFFGYVSVQHLAPDLLREVTQRLSSGTSGVYSQHR